RPRLARMMQGPIPSPPLTTGSSPGTLAQASHPWRPPQYPPLRPRGPLRLRRLLPQLLPLPLPRAGLLGRLRQHPLLLPLPHPLPLLRTAPPPPHRHAAWSTASAPARPQHRPRLRLLSHPRPRPHRLPSLPRSPLSPRLPGPWASPPNRQQREPRLPWDALA